MNVTVKLYALLGGYLPPNSRDNAADLRVVEGASVMDVIRQLNLPLEHCHLVLVNGNFVPPSDRDARVLEQGDALAIWPPIAGG